MKTTLTLILFLALTGPAQAQTPGQTLRDLAANQTHSWIDNGIGYPAMLARYKAGERLNVTCGFVSEVARRLLVERGYTARVVQVITRDEFDGLNDGHAMIEVFADRKWRLYDVDSNVRAVDANGQGISLVEQMVAVRENRAYWEPLASDPLFREDEPDEFLREAVRKVFADPVGFYKRIMGTAFLPMDAEGTGNNGLYYIDADQTERLRANGLLAGRYLTDASTWYNLTGVSPPAAPTSLAAPVASTVSAAAVPAATAEPKRNCKRLRARYRRSHTRRAHRRYLRCVKAQRVTSNP